MEETRKRRKVSAAAGSLNLEADFHDVSLDDDALTEILVRLPAKSVIRFKSVCKSWLSLISSEDFHRLYTLPTKPISLVLSVFKNGPRSPKQIIKTIELFYDINSNNKMMIKTRNEKQRIIPFNICRDSSVNAVLSCCWNGLLLIRNMIGEFHVYNPTTNQSQKILIPEYNSIVDTLHLVFDPSKSLHYKIVSIREDRIRTFDSESRTWSVCVEGFSTRGTCLFYLIHGGLLYCFNFVKNQFTAVSPLPKLADQGIVNGKILQESTNGCVYYCAFVMEHSFKSSTGAVLWELQVNEDGDDDVKWLLKYHHRIPRLPGFFVDMLAFVTETSTVLVHVTGYGKIMAYSFLDKTYNPLPLHHLEPLTYYVHVAQTLPSF